MLILGIDPGTAITGYGLVDYTGNKFTLIKYGTIRSDKDGPMAQRLGQIYLGISQLIEEYGPTHLAIEELFFNKNTKTALVVGQARGVAILAGHQKGLGIHEYTPLQVKQSVVGYGRADKNQVQFMVKAILNLEQIPTPDDAADALAIAICHGHSFNSALYERSKRL